MKNTIIILIIAFTALSCHLFSKDFIFPNNENSFLHICCISQPLNVDTMKICNSMLSTAQRGISENIPLPMPLQVAGEVETYFPSDIPKTETHKKSLLDEIFWTTNDSLHFETYLPAGGTLGVKVNIPKRKLEPIYPYNFADSIKVAIAKSPKWLQLRLEAVLGKLTPFRQGKIARVINDAVDPYIDEIAYGIAYTPAEYLNNTYCNPLLFVENAKLLYKNDSDLKYVDIVDYGSFRSEDENYYSTVKYWRLDSIKGKIQVEVPKEVYYMYIVHPKLADEVPAYINPNATDGLSAIAAPPLGVFWRNYLYNYTEKKVDTLPDLYPVLRDSMMKCEVLWDDKNQERQAVREISQWIRSVMKFDSKTERPHQPVRIFKLHLGRCGEHEDITNAAARSCLIPCRGISAYSSDHVWNEFWDKDWCQWEPVNNSHKDKLVYSEGWGKKFGSVIARQSDGVFIPVTSDYALSTSTITVRVFDSKNKPVDGAVLSTYMKVNMSGTDYIIPDSYGITNQMGACNFVLGTDNTYYVRADTKIGNNPTNANQVNLLIDKPQKGSQNNFRVTIQGNMPAINPKITNVPNDSINDFRVKCNIQAVQDVINWSVKFDDFGGSALCNSGPANFDLVITDSDNYTNYTTGKTFTALALNSSITEFIDNIDLSENSTYYIFVSNKSNTTNLKSITADFSLLITDIVGVSEQRNSATQNTTYGYPNPFYNNVNIGFNLPEDTYIKINIYNNLGVLVKSLSGSWMEAGLHQVEWDGTDLENLPVPNGIYYISIEDTYNHAIGRIILFKSNDSQSAE
ncbi:MAG: hypothetical protein HW421_3478 [Ignavibacteria bacterium]|nr:hypothetical protein [Ignavibacteria bacterium]